MRHNLCAQDSNLGEKLSIFGMFTSNKENPSLAPGYCRLAEFKEKGREALVSTGDKVGFAAQKELSSIFKELDDDSLFNEPLIITFFDEGNVPNRHKGALVYTESCEWPLLYCENALLGYSGSGYDVSRMILANAQEFTAQIRLSCLTQYRARQRNNAGKMRARMKLPYAFSSTS